MEKIKALELKARLMLEMGATYAEAAAKLLPKQGKRKAGKPSHWERITGGMCNADFEDKPQHALTARQIKDMCARSEHTKKAEAKFEKAAHLSGKAARKLSDTWSNRDAKNTRGFFDQGKAREMKRSPVVVLK